MAASENLKAELDRVAAQDDDTIDLANAALLLAALDHPASDLQIYRDHLRMIADQVAAAVRTIDLDQAAPEDLARILSAIIAGELRYVGDEETYNDLDNANLMRVIERRKGLPVSLGILYLFAAHAQGWSATGLNFPGHFLIRVESRDGRRAIVDPFHGGQVMEIHNLRELLKVIRGAGEELEAAHYAPVSNREILLRLQNNVKTRRLEQNDVTGALEALASMQAIDPQNVYLWREAGVMHMRLGHLKHAVEAFETFVAKAPEGPDRRKIGDVVQELRERLH
jgi:regulator of sirC expression with transglutaminase-like and TPR domain